MEQNKIEFIPPNSARSDAGKALRQNDVLFLFASRCKLWSQKLPDGL
jgi:hypothetical protein